MIIIAVLIILLIIICLQVVYELHHLKTREYIIGSKKIPHESEFRIVFISDLHLRNYGKDNQALIDMIKDNRPDIILIGGDMTVANEKHDEGALYGLLKRLPDIAPCFYAPGNHERRLKEGGGPDFEKRFEALIKTVKDSGITYLSNEGASFNGFLDIYGFDAEHQLYDKKQPLNIGTEYIKDRIKIRDDKKFNILLAHYPKYFNEYVKSGADLILSGHYHGGALKLFGKGIISPQFRLFPKYSFGRFEKENSIMLVTAGVGTHTINARLFNKPEVMLVIIRGS